MKPIGWSITDFAFNDNIRDLLQLDGFENQGRPRDGRIGHNFYTDGSFERKARNTSAAGWGFCALKDDKVLMEANGPVVIDRGSQYYIGAKKKSNNTAEISAMVELLLYLHSIGYGTCSQNLDIGQGAKINIYTDSGYVVGIATFRFKPLENVEMCFLG